jgi:hypothetical protein
MPEQGERLPPWLWVSTVAPPADAAVIDGAACRTRAGLFAEWAHALRFPEYFGHNWDALADSLRDVLAAAGPTLVVADAAQLLADEPPAELTRLLAVLDDVAAGEEPALRVILLAGPAEQDELRRRVIAAIRLRG